MCPQAAPYLSRLSKFREHGIVFRIEVVFIRHEDIRTNLVEIADIRRIFIQECPLMQRNIHAILCPGGL